MLEDGEELEDGELAPVMINTQVLPLSLHRGQSAHGYPSDGVCREQLLHLSPLVLAEVEADILKGPLLGAQRGGHEVVCVLDGLVRKMQLEHCPSGLAAARAGGNIHTPHHSREGAVEQGEGVFSQA